MKTNALVKKLSVLVNVVLFLVAAVLALLLYSIWTGNGDPLELVLPQGFQGHFVVIEDRNGEDVVATDGVYRIIVPPSRVVRIRSFAVFRGWREWGARYEQGPRLSYNEVNDLKLSLRGGGTASRNDSADRIEFFVGTEAEYREFDFATWSIPSDR